MVDVPEERRAQLGRDICVSFRDEIRRRPDLKGERLTTWDFTLALKAVVPAFSAKQADWWESYGRVVWEAIEYMSSAPTQVPEAGARVQRATRGDDDMDVDRPETPTLGPQSPAQWPTAEDEERDTARGSNRAVPPPPESVYSAYNSAAASQTWGPPPLPGHRVAKRVPLGSPVQARIVDLPLSAFLQLDKDARAVALEFVKMHATVARGRIDVELKDKDLAIKDREIIIKDKDLQLKDKDCEILRLNAELHRQKDACERGQNKRPSAERVAAAAAAAKRTKVGKPRLTALSLRRCVELGETTDEVLRHLLDKEALAAHADLLRFCRTWRSTPTGRREKVPDVRFRAADRAAVAELVARLERMLHLQRKRVSCDSVAVWRGVFGHREPCPPRRDERVLTTADCHRFLPPRARAQIAHPGGDLRERLLALFAPRAATEDGQLLWPARAARLETAAVLAQLTAPVRHLGVPATTPVVCGTRDPVIQRAAAQFGLEPLCCDVLDAAYYAAADWDRLMQSLDGPVSDRAMF